MKKLPMVFCSSNVETPLAWAEEFPGRLGVLLTPHVWLDPTGVPYVLDNGRYSVWSQGLEWDEKKFLVMLERAREQEDPPLWLVVPDVVGDGKATLKEWDKWAERLAKYGWPLAFAVQDGLTVSDVRALDGEPDILFIGGTKEWTWRTARKWCDAFPRCHIGKASTGKQLRMAHEAGAESTDSTVWKPVGRHLEVLRKYLLWSEKESRERETLHGKVTKYAPLDLERLPAMQVKDQVLTDNFALYNGDSCKVLPELPDESVGLSVFSPPFADLYSYSDDMEDMSNNRSYAEFFDHFRFLAEQLLRVTMPGRIVAIHCMPLPTFKKGGEEIGCRDFPGDIVRLFVDVGFIYHCPPITIWKDPLVAATRTKAIGLAHKQIVKDSTLCRTGFADYILGFRKPGENPVPVEHPEGLTEYCGARSVPTKFDPYINPANGEELFVPAKNKRSHWIWQQYASPVWMDIRQGKVLPFRQARDSDDERHICPLQTDVVERCLVLWSREGDIVLDPFGGVGTTGYVAVKRGRKAVMVELKKSYFKQMKRNMQSLSRRKQQFSEVNGDGEEDNGRDR